MWSSCGTAREHPYTVEHNVRRDVRAYLQNYCSILACFLALVWVFDCDPNVVQDADCSQDALTGTVADSAPQTSKLQLLRVSTLSTEAQRKCIIPPVHEASCLKTDMLAQHCLSHNDKHAAKLAGSQRKHSWTYQMEREGIRGGRPDQKGCRWLATEAVFEHNAVFDAQATRSVIARTIRVSHP